eukprot:8196032-Alexandrium_andersonii.AAC.1
MHCIALELSGLSMSALSACPRGRKRSAVRACICCSTFPTSSTWHLGVICLMPSVAIVPE